MSSQLVDFNADGYNDLVMGTFSGVAYLVEGSAKGYTPAQKILDRKKQPILLSAFWNYDSKKWDNADRSPSGVKHPQDHCISTVAVDWDADGDLDLLLGAKEGGIYLRRNGGKAGEPSFETQNERLMCGAEALAVPGGLTAPRLVDWNGDALFDLLCGSFDGGVYIYINEGEPGKPRFASGDGLISPGKDGVAVRDGQPVRPTRGSYVDAVDYDNDGDLDLLVGGYTDWTPPAPELTAAQEAQAAQLSAQIKALNAQRRALLAKLDGSLEGDARKKARSAITQSAEYKEVRDALSKARKARQVLKPGPQSQAYVWLYELR